jgi:poly(A) polymerase
VAFAREFARVAGGLTVVPFERFGTAMVRAGDTTVEFVGARKESYSPGSRNPLVSAGTLQDDLSRRDFTINAMAVSLNADAAGTLHDPLGGRRDLEARLLRTPLDPDATFADDPLRIMRALRFSSQLQFPIAPETLEAAGRGSPKNS